MDGPGTHCVDQDGLELRNLLPASASQELGLKVCTTTPEVLGIFLLVLRKGLSLSQISLKPTE